MSDTELASSLVERWRSGDEAAAEELFRRYSRRLGQLAERQLDDRLRRRVAPDDVVQSVFRSFFRRTAQGEYVIDASGSLWSLLAKMTLNKVRKQGERHRAAKRDIASEVDPGDDVLSPEALAREPTPEEAALLVEAVESLLKGLSAADCQVVQLCLEGHSSSEIASDVGCSRWTVRRVLARVGEQVKKRIDQRFQD